MGGGVPPPRLGRRRIGPRNCSRRRRGARCRARWTASSRRLPTDSRSSTKMGGGARGGEGVAAHMRGTGRCPRSPFRIKWSNRRRRPRRRRRRRRRRVQAARGHDGSRIKDPARRRERRRGRLGEGGQGEANILRRRCHCRRRAGPGVAVATGTNRARVQTHTAHGNGEIFLHTIYLLLLEVGGPTPRSAQTRAARQHRAPRQGASADVPMGSAGREGK